MLFVYKLQIIVRLNKLVRLALVMHKLCKIEPDVHFIHSPISWQTWQLCYSKSPEFNVICRWTRWTFCSFLGLIFFVYTGKMMFKFHFSQPKSIILAFPALTNIFPNDYSHHRILISYFLYHRNIMQNCHCASIKCILPKLPCLHSVSQSAIIFL